MPTTYLGLGFCSLFDTQEIDYVICITQHIQAKAIMSQLIRAYLEAFVLELGPSKIPLWDKIELVAVYATDSWILNT